MEHCTIVNSLVHWARMMVLIAKNLETFTLDLRVVSDYCGHTSLPSAGGYLLAHPGATVAPPPLLCLIRWPHQRQRPANPSTPHYSDWCTGAVSTGRGRSTKNHRLGGICVSPHVFRSGMAGDGRKCR